MEISDSKQDVLFSPLSVAEARNVHERLMAYIFTSKHKFVAEEATIMGDFINRGIAIGFAAGVTAALIARRHPLTRKHPNLLGFAVAGTVDAITRDYRRPAVYNKLIKLDTPLGAKSQSILYSLRTNSPEADLQFVGSSNRIFQEGSNRVAVQTKDDPATLAESSSSWWEGPSVEEQPTTSSEPTGTYPYGVVKVPSGVIGGSRTWEDIRRENEARRENASE